MARSKLGQTTRNCIGGRKISQERENAVQKGETLFSSLGKTLKLRLSGYKVAASKACQIKKPDSMSAKLPNTFESGFLFLALAYEKAHFP